MPHSGTRRRLASVARELKESVRSDWRVEGPYQWATVGAIHPTTPFSTLDVYLDSSPGNPGAVLALGIPYLNGYTPAIGDIVLVSRMAGAARTQRIVLGPLESTTHGLTQDGQYLGADFTASGVSGLLNASTGRWIGNWGTPGPPLGYTPMRGDWGYDVNGAEWFCTGTSWRYVGGGNYFCRVHLGTNQSLSINTWTVISLDTKDSDPNGNFDTSTHRFTAPISGYYRFTAICNFLTQVGFNFTYNKNVNPPTSPGTVVWANAATGATNTATGSDLIQLNAGDWITLGAFANAAATLSSTALNPTLMTLKLETSEIAFLQGQSQAISVVKGTHF